MNDDLSSQANMESVTRRLCLVPGIAAALVLLVVWILFAAISVDIYSLSQRARSSSIKALSSHTLEDSTASSLTPFVKISSLVSGYCHVLKKNRWMSPRMTNRRQAENHRIDSSNNRSAIVSSNSMLFGFCGLEPPSSPHLFMVHRRKPSNLRFFK